MGSSNSTIPPGPWNPLTILSIPRSAATVLTTLSRQYGPVFSFRAPGDPLTVVLNNYEVIREALIDNADAFPNRMTSPLRKSWGVRGRVFYSTGEDQKNIRDFVVKGLYDFYQTSLPTGVSKEAAYLCDVFESKNGEAFNPNESISLAAGNIMAIVNFGQRYDYDDPEYIELNDTLNYLFYALRPGPPVHKFPWLYNTFIYTRLRESQEYFKKFVQTAIEKHREDLDPSNPRDFIDLYLMRADKEENEEDALYEVSRAWYTIKDIFSSAANPGAAATQWIIALFCAYPEEQEKVYQEIKDVIGPNKPPAYDDLKQMPYTQAFIKETLRFRSAVPFGTRETVRDVTVGGYTIPEGSNVLVNYWAAQRDPDVWDQPELFNPERFLEDDNKTLKDLKHNIPLGIGHRNCLGQKLAMMELFHFGISLVQRFKLEFAPYDPKPKLDGICGATVVVEEYKLRAEKR